MGQIQNGIVNETAEEYFIGGITQDYDISQESQGSTQNIEARREGEGEENEEGFTLPASTSCSSFCQDGRSESLYDLYAVVHHQGALSGGHYVASLRSEIDNSWRLFNDAQVYDISSREIVDATAYILFYIRRDVKKVELSDFWDTTNRDGQGLTEEQIDKLVKHRERCVVS